MARKEIRMEELVEVVYQWHKRRNISQIKRAVGLTRKTIRITERERKCGHLGQVQ